ncbi:MAG: F0F1 ATP synthase subunit alpha, partial [Pseudomonadota bacterium]
LKQSQYQPLSMEKQITILFAGTRGFLDKYDIGLLSAYEEQMLAFVDSKYPKIFSEIREKKEIGKELEETMKKALSEFDQQFSAGK